LITFIEVIEKIEEPIIKIRGINNKGEYVEVRLKGISLDVRVSKSEGEQMRMIYQQNLIKPLNLKEIIKFLGLMLPEKEDTECSQEKL
jgi:hypothetical protein